MCKLSVYLPLLVLGFGHGNPAVSDNDGNLSGGLRVRYGPGQGFGKDIFYRVPLTISSAKEEGWTRAERPPGPLASLVMYCPTGRYLCALYDDTGFIAGLQLGLPQDEYTDSAYDWEAQGFTAWSPFDEDRSYWTNQQYFVSEEFLATDKNERIANRNSHKVLQLDGIWVPGFNRELYKISNKEKNIADSLFTKQACIPRMGRHYLYNMSTTTECSGKTLLPWSPMTHNGELVAVGFVFHGRLPVNPVKDWFERPDRTAAETVVPSAPKCYYDLIEHHGAIAMHIYYVDKPWLITCPTE